MKKILVATATYNEALNINKLINPLKLPFTFKMYPTIHRY